MDESKYDGGRRSWGRDTLEIHFTRVYFLVHGGEWCIDAAQWYTEPPGKSIANAREESYRFNAGLK